MTFVSGTCRICLNNFPNLSWDHVPPQGCGNNYSTNNTRYRDSFDSVAKYKTSQNGIKFQTVCRQCNSDLGTKYDPDLIRVFTNAKLMLSIKEFSWNFILKINGINVIAALYGHFLAANVHSKATRYDIEMRDWLMSDLSSIPPINLFYYFHPGDNSFVARDYAYVEWVNNLKHQAVIAVIKFFPFGFVATDEPYFHGLPKVNDNLFFGRRYERPYYWLEEPPENGFILASELQDESIRGLRKYV